MRPGILPEHCFEPKGNHYATLPWFGIKIAQKYAKRDQKKRSSTQVFVATWNPGRVPFDQKFRFEFPKFSYVKWHGISHQAGPISFFSRLSTFPTKNYSTKCWKIVMKWLLSSKVIHVEKFNTHSEFNSSLIFLRELNLRTFLAG